MYISSTITRTLQTQYLTWQQVITLKVIREAAMKFRYNSTAWYVYVCIMYSESHVCVCVIFVFSNCCAANNVVLCLNTS